MNIVNHVKEKYQLFYSPSSKVTVSFKGKIVFCVYNPNNLTQSGPKMFILSDSINGYIFNFNSYYRKQEDGPQELIKMNMFVTGTVLVNRK